MAIKDIANYLAYAVFPLGVIVYGFTNNRVEGFESLVQLVGRAVIYHMATIAIATVAFHKIKFISDYARNVSDPKKLIIQYLLYAVCFPNAALVVGILILGHSINSDDEIIPDYYR